MNKAFLDLLGKEIQKHATANKCSVAAAAGEIVAMVWDRLDSAFDSDIRQSRRFYSHSKVELQKIIEQIDNAPQQRHQAEASLRMWIVERYRVGAEFISADLIGWVKAYQRKTGNKPHLGLTLNSLCEKEQIQLLSPDCNPIGEATRTQWKLLR